MEAAGEEEQDAPRRLETSGGRAASKPADKGFRKVDVHESTFNRKSGRVSVRKRRPRRNLARDSRLSSSLSTTTIDSEMDASRQLTIKTGVVTRYVSVLLCPRLLTGRTRRRLSQNTSR